MSIMLSEESWTANVVKPSIRIIKSYFDKDASFVATNGTKGLTLIGRDLWTQHICKACVNKVLRGGAVHMSGNNINKEGVVAKEFVNLESPGSLAMTWTRYFWKNNL